ncbi:MAG: asparagine synthase (glutamine-hydrolyzing) [Saprospiraceae bacterium]|nr:asparagine synthase (glutamine-hydrolyzing) [Saprospiraceae bacterium]
MCGINGFVDKSISIEFGVECLKSMAQTTSHRGPDDMSLFHKHDCYLAHNRLSIIDLSNAGNQPMHLGNLSIVFNGEIYNYKEIKTELLRKGYNFVSNSDTEVILVSYKEWGDECVKMFVGMWAFAIYNATTQNLFCSRDRFGIKPFYYIKEGSSFYFSSEVKALKKTRLFKSEINETQIRKAIQLGWIAHEEDTLYLNIRQLEPATNINFCNSIIEKSVYWHISDTKILHNSQTDIVEEFKDKIVNSLNLHIRSDVPLGATLSGGIDSSSIVSCIVNQNILPKIETFTIYYDEAGDIDERPFAKSVIEKYKDKIIPHFLKPTENEVATQFDKITFQNDFPLLGSSPISQYFIMKEISKYGIKVILSGQGADDYLGGYMHTYYRLYAQLISDLKLRKLYSEFNCHKKYQNLTTNSIFQIGMKSFASLLFSETNLLEKEFKYGLKNVFDEDSIKINSTLNSLNKFDQFHEGMLKFSSLPNLLHYEDRNSMAFSIESRVPLLDHRLVEFAFSLPMEYKIQNGYTKWILRQAMQDFLPEKVYSRKDKIGFVTPGEVKWLRNDLGHLLNTDFSLIPGIKKQKANQLKEQFLKGDNSNGKIIWRLANMQKWLKNL